MKYRIVLTSIFDPINGIPGEWKDFNAEAVIEEMVQLVLSCRPFGIEYK